MNRLSGVGDRFEAIIVGAGPAGSTAARRLALRGRAVLLLERAKLPRHKACGGGLTGNVRKALDFELGDVVETRIQRILYVFKGRYSVLHRLEGLNMEMVQRPLFDNLLTKKAVEAGATLLDETPLKRLVLDNGTKLVETPKGTFQADVVIGADGAASLTARAAGLRPNARPGIAMDAEVTVPADTFQAWKRTAIFDFGLVPHGLGWVFPKGTFFSIGVGTFDERCANIRAHLDALIRCHDCLSDPLSMTVRAAPLPNWTHEEPLARDGVFLVGDAAGLLDPLSGEGISYAVRSGVIASHFADAWLAGDHTADIGYSEEISHRGDTPAASAMFSVSMKSGVSWVALSDRPLGAAANLHNVCRERLEQDQAIGRLGPAPVQQAGGE